MVNKGGTIMLKEKFTKVKQKTGEVIKKGVQVCVREPRNNWIYCWSNRYVCYL